MLNKDLEVTLRKADKNQLKAKPDPNKLGFGIYFTDHMFVMRWNRQQGWHNAEITPYQNFSLDPAAMVFHYGQAIFEGMKAYRDSSGQILLFRPTDNLERMNSSALRLCMPRIPVNAVLKALKALIYLDRDWVPYNDGATLYLRPTMIATEPVIGLRSSEEYIFFIIKSPVGAYYAEGFNPVRIYVEDTYVRAAPGGVGAAKTAGNYAASLKAMTEANKKGYSQVLWLDAIDRKYIEEVGTSNIFFVIGDQLITPKLSGSILPGITRDSILQLARDLGIKTQERRISIDEVIAAQEDGSLREAFGSGTAAVISPVGELCYQDRTIIINGGRVGDLSRRLYDNLQDIQRGRQEDVHKWLVRVG
ncbi:MAG: branched-chain amino acid aminotransferase [Deltaproteobacteria bacterium]|nr:branched-chain amino acid aminotransferase [Deltaproteobacteria bacterium]